MIFSIFFKALPYILINITVLLLNSTWNAQYGNRRNQDFKNLSYIIEHSVSISDSRPDSLMQKYYLIYS